MNGHISFPGKIHLIDSDQKLLSMHVGAVQELGFDTETRPSFKQGEVYRVALLQLATEVDAYLIRLHRVSSFHVLKNILEDGKVTKVGVAIRDDLRALQKMFSFIPQGFVELQDVAKKKGLENIGLKGMTQEVLNQTLSKKAKITNWEARQLTEPQLLYAATDAWVGLTIYRKLISR